MSETALDTRIHNQPIDTKKDSDARHGQDARTDEQKKTEQQLAERLCGLIEDANSRVVPIIKTIRQVRQFNRLRTVNADTIAPSTLENRKYGGKEGGRSRRGRTRQGGSA